MERSVIWHPVFFDGKADITDKREAVAIALNGWAICTAGGLGEKIPPKFGEAMVFLSDIVGENLTPDNAMAIADKYL